MKIQLFHQDHFKEFKSWSCDAEFHRRLGPINDEWLNFVINEKSGRQYSVFDDGKLVAVVGIVLPDDMHNFYVLTDLSVSPLLKSKGIGSSALKKVLEIYQNDIKPWKTYIEIDNEAAIRLFKKNGWTTNGEIDENSMICFNLCLKTSSDTVYKFKNP